MGVLDFLELPDDVDLGMVKKKNQSGEMKHKWIKRLMSNRTNPVLNGLRRLMSRKARKQLRNYVKGLVLKHNLKRLIWIRLPENSWWNYIAGILNNYKIDWQRFVGMATLRSIQTFLCIGVQKAGTTTLADILATHPDICIPEVKETKFFYFAEDYSKGIDHYNHTFIGMFRA